MVIPHPGAIFLKEVLSVKKSGLKFFALVFSAVLALMCLSGCGNNSSSPVDYKYSKEFTYVEDETFGYNVYTDHAELKSFFGAATLEVTIPSEVTDPETKKAKPITVIGKSAFKENTGAKTLNIPDSVIEIKSNAFKNCSGIVTLNFGKNLKRIGTNAFYGCMSISEIKLPESLESIGAYAFSGCSTAENLELANVGQIGDYAFEKCISVNNITGGDNLVLLGENAFSDTPWFAAQEGEFVTIGKALVKYNGTANEIELDGKIEGVSNAFAEKDNITKINMPSVKFVCNNAFSGCTALSDITLSDDTEFIGYAAFKDTPYISYLTADENGFTTIGKVIVKYTGSQETITIPDEITMISDAFSHNETIKKVSLGKSVKWIGADAFYSCTALRTFVCNEALAYIDNYALDGTTLTTFDAGSNTYAAYWAKDYGLKNIVYK